MIKNIDKVIKENKYLTEENIRLNKELNVLVNENVNLFNQNRKLIKRLGELENNRLTERYLNNDIFIERILKERILK